MIMESLIKYIIREGRLIPELARMEWRRTEKIGGLAALAAAISAENYLSENIMLYFTRDDL